MQSSKMIDKTAFRFSTFEICHFIIYYKCHFEIYVLTDMIFISLKKNICLLSYILKYFT